MTTTNIHSLVELVKPIDTDIIVCNATGKDLPAGVLAQVSKKGFVHNTSFMPLTVDFCLFFDHTEAAYQKYLQYDVIDQLSEEIQQLTRKQFAVSVSRDIDGLR